MCSTGPLFAICACGAHFHDCEDDREDASNHIGPNGSNHRWVWLKEKTTMGGTHDRISFRDTEGRRSLPCVDR